MSSNLRPQNKLVSAAAIALGACLLASCSMGPPPEITNSLRSGYSLDKVSVAFSDDATVFVTGATIPENATKPVMQEFAREAIAKGVKNRLGEIMTGPGRAHATVTVKILNCPEVPAIIVIGGFSYLQAEVTMTDAETGAEIYPKRALVATDSTGFGVKNFEAAKRIETGGDRNCTLVIAHQFASLIVGVNTAGPIRIQY